MPNYYATYREGNNYPIVKVSFERGDFQHRTEIPTGELFKTGREAFKRTGLLNQEVRDGRRS
jgi:hypothetical protein